MKKLLCAISFCLMSMASTASFVEKDWKNTGDKLITLDTQTGLEWLDLSVTNPDGTDNSKLENIFRRTQNAIEPGYEHLNYNLNGWRIATRAELTTLFEHVYPSLPSAFQQYQDYQLSDTTKAEKEYFLNIFGANHSSLLYEAGVFCDNITSINNLRCSKVFWQLGNHNFGLVGTGMWLDPWPNHTSRRVEERVFLVRNEDNSEDNSPDSCPAQLNVMTRQQALQFISHLADQLEDLNTTTITPLNF